MLVNSTQNTQPAAQISSRQNLGSKDIFLQILIAQMRNQDPLKPQDAAQMSSQLAQFNMVEQQISTNKLLENILSGLQSQDSSMASAAPLIGHQATAKSSQFTFDGSTPQNFIIKADQQTPTSTVEVIDSSGSVINTLYSGPLAAGANTITWSGASSGGGAAAPGEYSIRVIASDINGYPSVTSTQITGTVNAVRITPDGTFAVVGSTPVAVTNIAEIQ